MFKNFGVKNLLPIITLATLLISYALLLAHPINLVTADLGRHIKNGEIIWNEQFNVLKTNFYSYTHPNFPTTNHHWLSGLVFYGLWKLVGFKGIHIFFILISLATLFIFFRIATTKSSPAIVALVALPLLPILLERDEIRPEIFSYLLASIFFWLILKIKNGQANPKYLFILPVLQIVWTNLHIYFFLGPVILGTFLIEALIEKNSLLKKKLSLTFLLSIIATAITPFGINSTLAPLTIFKNFGYRLAENQSVWFIEKILPNPNYLIFKIIFLVLILSLIARIWRLKSYKTLITDIVFTLGFSIAGWFAIRNFAIFGLFALPLIASNLANLFNSKPEAPRWLDRTVLATLILTVLIILSGEFRTIYPKAQKLGLGLENGNTTALDFFKENNLTGPIFNNYDIGGYLIFGFENYPEQNRRVFTDNRPEAYPAEFFEKTLIPMQEDKEIWDEKNSLYKFNAIIFSYRDYTPWGQAFFARILNDPEWKTVFADNRVIILLKNNELNKNIIAKYGQSLKIKVAN
ncbi:MAG: hypothetical protein Q8Q90_03045 [bacterium]|nr:hypothetical protein [bacterium]